MYFCVPYHVHAMPADVETNVKSPKTGVLLVLSNHMGTRELNLSPLEEQSVLVTTEQSLRIFKIRALHTQDKGFTVDLDL